MQKYFRSIAMIRRHRDERVEWLGLWSPTRSQWEFIVGERLEHESFRETILREVSWRLGLDRDRDLLVSNMSRLNTEYVGCVPGENAEKHIALAFYAVDVYRASAIETIFQTTKCDWLTSKEVCDGMRADRSLIDPIISAWINRWEIIQPWT